MVAHPDHERHGAPAVTIRPIRPSDAPLLDRWRLEPSVREHQPLSDSSTAQLLADLHRQRHEDLYASRGEKFQWVIQHDLRPAGWITLVIINWSHGLAEIGYALSTEFQRKGLMGQALRTLLSDLFSRTAVRRVEARCAVDNQPSQQVLERVGFEREGFLRGYFVLRGKPVDNYLYAILKSDWAS
ncbi:MAG: GNAT family N-acetyltransferase [Thermoanaerobaculia bacterium]